MVGGQFGEGALIKGGKTAGYYNTVQVSYGLQAGIQKYGYALFLMTDSAIEVDRQERRLGDWHGADHRRHG